MKVLVFDTDERVRQVFSEALPGHDLVFIDDRISPEALKGHGDAEVLSVFVCSGVTKEHLDLLPALRCIATRSTGVDHIDAAAVKERGIVLCNVPSYGAHTVAEFTFALLLSVSRRLPEASNQVREDGSFETKKLEGFDLFGKTLGVVGTGAIGANVVKIAQGFGMQVLMSDKFPKKELENENARYVELEELLRNADIVTLHVPYLPENHHLLDKEKLALMKHGAYLINTARGELIDTEALLTSLKSGALGGAGLDVLEGERALKDEVELIAGDKPIDLLKDIISNHALIDIPRVIITPHIAFFSREAYTEILSISAKNIVAFASGEASNAIAL